MSKNFRAGTRRPERKIYQVVGCDKLNLRLGPGTRHDVLFVLNKGDEVIGIPVEDTDWIRVACIDGSNTLDGYCMSDFLNEVGDYAPDNS